MAWRAIGTCIGNCSRGRSTPGLQSFHEGSSAGIGGRPLNRSGASDGDRSGTISDPGLFGQTPTGRIVDFDGRTICPGKRARIRDWGLCPVRNRFPHRKLRYEMVGYGPEEDKLRRLIQELRLEDSAILLGPKDYPGVIERLYAADLFLFPSLRRRWARSYSKPRPRVCRSSRPIPAASAFRSFPIARLSWFPLTIRRLGRGDLSADRQSPNLARHGPGWSRTCRKLRMTSDN